MQPFSDAGYRVIAPDYRGAGYSSHPPDGFTKDVLSSDLHRLVGLLDIKDRIHVVGHDIGGMIAHAYAAQFPNDVASVIWGECPLPGTEFYERTKHDAPLWHFNFHSQGDIAEALVAGKEKIYVKHFFDRLAQNPAAISNDDLDFYAQQYSAPGAIRCAFATYRMFEQDAETNRQWASRTKVKVKNMVLNGGQSFLGSEQMGMAKQMYENPREGLVEGSGHWLAEENPGDFVQKVLGFIES